MAKLHLTQWSNYGIEKVVKVVYVWREAYII